MKGEPRRRRLAVDASFDHETNAAGISVASPGRNGQAFVFDVVVLGGGANIDLAEAAAVLRGLEWLEEHEAPGGSIIYTDSLNVVTALKGGCNRGVLIDEPALIERIKELVVASGHFVAWQGRDETKAAHWGALLALRAWRAGRSGAATRQPTAHRKIRARLSAEAVV